MTEKIISSNSMNEPTKNQLIHQLLEGITLDDLKILVDLKKELYPTPRKSVTQMTKKYEDTIINPPIEFRDEYKPKPLPRTKTVKKMVQEYEDNIIQPPIEFRDKPIPLPRTKKTVEEIAKPTPLPRTKKTVEEIAKPIPLPRTKITVEKIAKALKGYTTSYIISIINNKDPLLQIQNARLAVGNHIKKVLSDMKGIKFNETLKVTFWKPQDDGWIYKTAYFNSKPQTIINDININEALQLTKQQILNFIAQWISEGSGWTLQSVDSHYINLVKYEPLKGSSYIQLPTELRNSAKGLINLKNNDNECFRWCHIRHLNPQDKYPQRIKKSDKEYIDRLDYSDIEFPVTTKQYNKIKKQNEVKINVFGYEDKQPYPIYVSKEKYEDHMELLLITKNEKKHYVLIKDFNKFMFNQTKHKN